VTRSGVDLEVLRPAIRRLGFDPNDPSQLTDLAAVAITRLAWRDGPVEDWHAVPDRRISDGEMMRATVATTRFVRNLIRNGSANLSTLGCWAGWMPRCHCLPLGAGIAGCGDQGGQVQGDQFSRLLPRASIRP
jgi:hypothetical protein